MLIIPGEYPLPLLPHIFTQGLLLVSIVAGNRNLCENRLASPDLALHLSTGATYIQAASDAAVFVPYVGSFGARFPLPPLPCEALLGFVQVWGAVLGTGFILLQDVLSRRWFLNRSADRLGPVEADMAGMWPLGQPGGLNACLTVATWLFLGGVIIWQYMLVLVFK